MTFGQRKLPAFHVERYPPPIERAHEETPGLENKGRETYEIDWKRVGLEIDKAIKKIVERHLEEKNKKTNV